jgi:hypothetical protein
MRPHSAVSVDGRFRPEEAGIDASTTIGLEGRPATCTPPEPHVPAVPKASDPSGREERERTPAQKASRRPAHGLALLRPALLELAVQLAPLQ